MNCPHCDQNIDDMAVAYADPNASKTTLWVERASLLDLLVEAVAWRRVRLERQSGKEALDKFKGKDK